MYVLQFGNSCKIPSQITCQSQIHTLKPDDFNLRRVGNLSHRRKEPTVTCGSAPLINPRPQFPMPLWNFLQVRSYEKRYIPDFQFWSRLPCRFTESIAKKRSPNEMSSWGASLALGNVHRKDAFRGIQTSLDLWLPAKLCAGPFGTSLTAAFPQGPGQVPGGSTLIGVCTAERNHKSTHTGLGLWLPKRPCRPKGTSLPAVCPVRESGCYNKETFALGQGGSIRCSARVQAAKDSTNIMIENCQQI